MDEDKFGKDSGTSLVLCHTEKAQEFFEKIIDFERPDALLPTLGGQTALNVAVELAESGVLERYGVECFCELWEIPDETREAYFGW